MRGQRPDSLYLDDYKRLLFGGPIALDVLGVAPIDRLGELTWLGPASVVVFGFCWADRQRLLYPQLRPLDVAACSWARSPGLIR